MGQPFIIDKKISKNDLIKLTQQIFGDMIKLVVDIEKEKIALDGELHADEEALMLEQGSQQKNLWGANIYPQATKGKQIEYTSLINIRPTDDNRSMTVENEKIKKKMETIINTWIEL
ncbi:MAG: DUF5674 family protein [Patescibacteria group bacterium]